MLIYPQNPPVMVAQGERGVHLNLKWSLLMATIIKINDDKMKRTPALCAHLWLATHCGFPPFEQNALLVDCPTQLIYIWVFFMLSSRVGQFQVYVSNFFLQLNFCMCYRKNQFGPIVRPLRVLLTLAHSRIWSVNRFTRGKNCPILLKVNGS